MQLLLTTGSLREQQATAILIKTGIQGKVIYRVTVQTHAGAYISYCKVVELRRQQ